METQEKILYDLLTDVQKSELELFVTSCKQYYSEEDVLMPDDSFDELKEKLLSYDISELTQFIEGRLWNNDAMEVVDEATQMISLKKFKIASAKIIDELQKFFGGEEVEMEERPKIDGCALKISWDVENKKVENILTRGGMDVTEKFKNHPDILKTLSYGKSIITAELAIRKDIFEKHYSNEWKNPRNFVGKLLKQDRIERSVWLHLSVVPLTDGVNNLPDCYDFEHGCYKNEHVGESCNNIIKIDNEFINLLHERIKVYKNVAFPFLCDGIVLAVKEKGARRVKDNYPLNMLAVKFPSTRVRATVVDIEWTQKKSAELTPIIVVAPVNFDGTTVTRCSGYNYAWLQLKGIGIGAEIEITKSGDIIPIPCNVITKSINIKMPSFPHKVEGINLVSLDDTVRRRYKFESALLLFDIAGIGTELANKVGDCVNYDIVELFNTQHKASICEALGGGATFKKFLEFYNIKVLSLDVVIAMLMFDGVGETLSQRLARLLVKQSEDTSRIPEKIMNLFFGVDATAKETLRSAGNRLKSYGIAVTAPSEHSADMLTFEMTGEPPMMTKAEFAKRLSVLRPNSKHTSLTKDTKALFTDSLGSNTGKMNKARKYNIKIVSYADALAGKI